VLFDCRRLIAGGAASRAFDAEQSAIRLFCPPDPLNMPPSAFIFDADAMPRSATMSACDKSDADTPRHTRHAISTPPFDAD